MKPSISVLLKRSFFEVLKIDELSHNFPMHIHKRLCVGIIDSGEKYLFINGDNYILKTNDFFLIPSYMPHKCYVKAGNTTSYTVLCIDDINNISEEIIVDDIKFSPVDIKVICSLYNYAAKTINNHYRKEDNIITKLIKYIDENYAEQLSVEFLADIASLNSYYLLHLFKEKIGLSLHQYIIQTRIKKLQELYTPNKSILDIALSCGFYDQSHFIRHFKKYVGITPKMYFDSLVII